MAAKADIASLSTAEINFVISLGRAVAGALLFSLPMFMTMEMWSLGSYIPPLRLALLLVLLAPFLFGLSCIGGMRHNPRKIDDVADAMVAVAIAVVTAAPLLWLFGLLTPDMTLRDVIGKVALQVVAAAMGAMLAQNQLGNSDEPGQEDIVRTYWGQIFLMGVGALFLSLNIAPTAEVEVISFKMTIWHELAIFLLSIVMLHSIVYAVNFQGAVRRDPARSFFSIFARFTIVGYVVVAAVNLYFLWTFGRLEGLPPAQVLSLVIVLSFPGALGAAVARLML